MLGRRPYVGRSRKEIRDQILAKQVQIKRSEIPDGWSLEAADFINRVTHCHVIRSWCNVNQPTESGSAVQRN
jgi:hypothetical protein